jgi:adenosinetriphosphatase
MNLFNTSYDVYSHAYLCYGQDQIRLIYQGQLVQQANGAVSINDPCLQPGYRENITYNELFSSPCVTSRYRASSSFTSKMNITFR